MKTIFQALCALLLGVSVQGETIIYNNTANFEGQESSTSFEMGDQIRFAGTERVITRFEFEYYAQTMGAINPQLRLRLYLNDGPIDPGSSLPTPGTMIYQSSPVTIFTFGQGYSAMTVSGMALAVSSDSITWAVEFSGFPPDGEAGLLRYASPSVGTSGDFVWKKETGAWRAVTLPGKSNNFSARVSAIQGSNPSPVREQQIVLSGKYSFAGIELVSGSNSLADLFPDAPVGMVLYKFDNANGYSAFQKYSFGWSQPEAKLLSGEGFIAVMPPIAGDTNTFVSYETTIKGTSPASFPTVARGWNLVSGGRLQAGPGKISAQDGDKVLFLNKNSSMYEVSSFQTQNGVWDPPLSCSQGDGAWYLAGESWAAVPGGSGLSEKIPVYVNNLSEAYGINARFVSDSGVPLTGGQAQLIVVTSTGQYVPVGAPIPLGTGEFAGYVDPRANLIRYVDSSFTSSSVNLVIQIRAPDFAGQTAPIQVFGGANPLSLPNGLVGLEFVPELNSPSIRMKEWNLFGQSARVGIDIFAFGNVSYYIIEISDDLKTWRRVTCPAPFDFGNLGSTGFEVPSASQKLFFRARAASTAEELRVGNGIDCGGL